MDLFRSKIREDATSDEDSGCKSCRGQGMEQARDSPSMECEIKSKKGGHERGTEKQQSPLCFIDGLMSSQEFGVGDTIPEVQRKSRASRRHCERRLRSLPDCDGQAADAISAYTQVRMEDAQKLLKIPKSERPDVWIRLPKHKWPKSRAYIEDRVFPLGRNLHGHPLAGILWERQFEKSIDRTWLGKKVPNCECLFVHRKQKLFLSVYVDDIKMAGKKQNLAPMWKTLMKDVDIGEPTSFLDHENLGCTQRECKPNEKIIGQYHKMFESHISAGATEKLPGSDKPRAKTSAWSHDMEGHARKCVERFCELANKRAEQLYKVSHPCLHDH